MQEFKPEHELLAETLRRLVQRFASCRKAGLSKPGGIERFVETVAAHLTDFDPAELPLAARTIWHDRIARPLKAEPTKPLSEQEIAALRSWPAARLKLFDRALGDIEKIVREAEIEARNEIVRATISREYS